MNFNFQPTMVPVMENSTFDHAGDQKVLHHQITLGAVLFRIGLRATDAPALEALLLLAFSNVARGAAKLDSKVRLYDVMRELIDSQHDVLTARGKARELERCRATYLAARRDWERNGETGPDAKWRQRYMTKGQRFYIHMVCHVERLQPPANMTRGEAADWLEAHDVHHLYRRERD